MDFFEYLSLRIIFHNNGTIGFREVLVSNEVARIYCEFTLWRMIHIASPVTHLMWFHIRYVVGPRDHLPY